MLTTHSVPTGFDTSRPGTPHSRWDTLECRPWSPPQRSLIVVTPHPDDETLGAGGLIHHYTKRHLRVTVISVTDGEAACPEMPHLASRRQAELHAALARLGVYPARIIRLGLPDGRVADNAGLLTAVLRAVTPHDALIVAPFERDGHPDHDATSRVAREVASEQGVALATYPIWAWHQAEPEVFSGCRRVNLLLDTEAQAAKHSAIHCYVSQLSERPGGPIVPPHVLTYFDRPYETFLL